MADRLLQGSFISGIFSFIGFRLEYVSLDFMHIADLGVTQYFLGAVLWEVFLFLDGIVSRPGAAMGRIMTLIKLMAKELKTQAPISTLTLSMFRSSATKPVKFRGNAAQTRHLLPIILEILRIALPITTCHEKTRFQCCLELTKVYDEVINFTAGAAERAAEHCRRFNILYVELAMEQWHREGKLVVWRITPKFHLLNHLCEEMDETGSAADHWCYADEREIGKACKLAELTHAKTTNKTLMSKYRTWDL